MFRFHESIGKLICPVVLLLVATLVAPSLAVAQSTSTQSNVTYRRDYVTYIWNGVENLSGRAVDIRGNYTLANTSTIRDSFSYARIYYIGLYDTSNKWEDVYLQSGQWSRVLNYRYLSAYRVEFGINRYQMVSGRWVYQKFYTLSSPRYVWQ